ncbi:MAG: hypothetical protein JKY48_14925 [Flavobacteriales bacterium]|nr:hypothetical protein [Flavobacteriales bacterium]
MKKLLLPLFLILTMHGAMAQGYKTVSYYIGPTHTSTYLNIQDDAVAFTNVPMLVKFYSSPNTVSNMISIGGRWLVQDSTNADTILLLDTQPEWWNQKALWNCQPNSTSPSSFVIQNASNNKYLNAGNYEWLNLTDSSNTASPGTLWRSEFTPFFVKKSFFLDAAGSPANGYLAVKDDSVGDYLTPTPVEFFSSDGGKTALISFGNYWLTVYTNRSPAVVVLEEKQGFFPHFQDRYLWSIERAISPTVYGATYGIKCRIDSVDYYLNNANYSSLDLQPADSLIWGTNGAGNFWHFHESTPELKKGNLVLYGREIRYPDGDYDGTTLAANSSVFKYSGGALTLESGTTSSGIWNWHLDRIANAVNPTWPNNYAIRITNASNDQKYVVPGTIPSTNNESINETIEVLTVANENFAINSSNKKVNTWQSLQNLEPFGSDRLALSFFAVYINGTRDSINQSINWRSSQGFSSLTSSNAHPNDLTTAVFDHTFSSNYFISSDMRTLQAKQRATKSFPVCSGKVIQPLSYREVGSDKFYIYGSNEELYAIKNNKNFSNIFDTTIYHGNRTKPIRGASIHNSYMYLIHEDGLWLYTLFGIKNNYKGFVSQIDVGGYDASAPVYNPISHKVYVLYNQSNNNYVFEYGQGLDSTDHYSYNDTINNHIPKAPLELFVIPENEPKTKLYYQNIEGKLVSLQADANSIEIAGEPIDVSEREIRWLRYKTRLLNHHATTAGMSIVPIQNGYVASGAIGADSTYALFFINNSILQSTQASIYVGPNAAFPSFNHHYRVPDVAYTNTMSFATWTVQDANGKNLWMEDSPLIFYDSTSQSFTVEALTKKSSFSDESSIYFYEIAMNQATTISKSFNLEWQKLAGKEVDKIKDGSPLHNWYQIIG